MKTLLPPLPGRAFSIVFLIFILPGGNAFEHTGHDLIELGGVFGGDDRLARVRSLRTWIA